MANEGVQIPGEGEGASLNPELHRQAVEQKAATKGWKPLTQYDGDPADWVDAPEFLGRQRLYDTIHDLRRDNKKFQKDLQTITKHFANMEDAAYQRALADLKQKQAQAVEDQDATAVAATTDQIVELQKKHTQQQAQQTNPSAEANEEFNSWREKNTWFDQNAEMREDAVSIGIGYAMRNPNKSQQEVMDYVEDRIKKSYPDKFKKVQTQQRSAPTVESGGGNGAESSPGKKKGKLTVADLDDVERSVMNTFLKRGVLKDKAAKMKMTEQEVYLADLAQRKGL